MFRPSHVPFQKAQRLADFFTARVFIRAPENGISKGRYGIADEPLMGSAISPMPKISYLIYIVRREHYKNIFEVR